MEISQKKIIKEKSMKVVYIEWKDGTYHINKVLNSGETTQVANIYTAGFLVEEDDEKIVIGVDYNKDEQKYRHIFTRLKSSIKSIHIFDTLQR